MINFKKTGNGKKTLVFLHGWGGSWQSWGPIIDKFTIYNSQFTIYAVDLPGFGLSKLSKPYNLADYCSDLAGFFKKEKIDKPVLVGHSFGGQVATKFALLYPELLSGLVLVDSASLRANDSKMKLNIKIARLGKQILFSTPLAFLYPRLRPIYYQLRGMKGSDYYGLKIGSNLQKTAGVIFREDLSSDYAKIKLPTLIFWGEKDPPELTPLKFGEKLHNAIKGSKMVVVPGAGHFSYLDDPERFTRELVEFCKL